MSVSKSMLITFTIFIPAIFHVSDLSSKTRNGKQAVRGEAREDVKGVKPEPGEGVLSPSRSPTAG